ncbi:HTH-type transcriptional regulator DmlR [Shimia sp. SK013]|uniref:LysR family transcriptional regulator n=1 Tax=Shimia sp. SK013 TaxID=1389006 RepID=UPI0006B401C2|nr:LysR family transcriptional regulator [Shimia sp. SK013]KPA20729.1 HTH-type transcriptional regulator DmlR [Shimia sp. SK013]
MIDRLKHMAVFARVVDEGTFRAAAKSVGLAPSRVSEIVTELENYLGATLLYRTTRKIALTNEGRVFYARAVEMVRSAETGLNELNALALDPVGALRISVPAFMSSSGLMTSMGDFATKHPHVALSISFTDVPVDLIEDGFDLSIRVGWLDDSSMMSRKLGHLERVLVAGADYVASRPVPKHPTDLETWDWISYAQRSDNIAFKNQAGEVVRVSGNSQIQVDNVDALRHLTSQNLGATVMPRYLAEDAIKRGKYAEVIVDWKLKPLGVFAVWPDQLRRENLTVLFVRFLADNFDN